MGREAQDNRRRWIGPIALAALLAASSCGDSGDETNGVDEFLRMPSDVMKPTFQTGDVLPLDRDAFVEDVPQAGDVIAFNPPAAALSQPLRSPTACGQPVPPGQPCPEPGDRKGSLTFIMRVVAGPGDRFSLNGGAAVVNGEREVGAYFEPCSHESYCDLPQPVRVPSGHFVVLADQRRSGNDSRYWGPVPADWIIGKIGPGS